MKKNVHVHLVQWFTPSLTSHESSVMSVSDLDIMVGLGTCQSTVGGPKWTPSGQNGRKWTVRGHFGLANAKNPVQNRVILTKVVV